MREFQKHLKGNIRGIYKNEALKTTPLSPPVLSGFVEMKNELLCGVATVVDCIYGTKLNLMLLAISS